MSGNKIINIDGSKAAVRGEPVEVVVEALEEMLDLARRGQINTIACVFGVRESDHFRVNYLVRGPGMGFDMIGGLEMAKTRIKEKMQ